MSRVAVILAVVAVALSAGRAAAFDAGATFKGGTHVLSAEAGRGTQDNFEGHRFQTGLEFWNAGVRFGMLPFDPVLPGPLHGSLEVGLEPFYQGYISPRRQRDSFFGGVGLVLRYHLLALGRVVPYIEAMAAAGGTDLETREIRSVFTFLVHGGVGASFFVTDHVSLYAGYRLQHVSNGNTEAPNRGFESHVGVGGMSVFFR